MGANESAPRVVQQRVDCDHRNHVCPCMRNASSREVGKLTLSEREEIRLLHSSISAWEENDISAMLELEAEIRVKLVNPSTQSRDDLEAEVGKLRRQVESLNYSKLAESA